jgi:hypothetical protein
MQQVSAGRRSALCARDFRWIAIAAGLCGVLAAGSARAGLGTAIEYYNPALRHYFITAYPEEAAALGWTLDSDDVPRAVRRDACALVWHSGCRSAVRIPERRCVREHEHGDHGLAAKDSRRYVRVPEVIAAAMIQGVLSAWGDSRGT